MTKYLQKAWAESIDNIDITDVTTAMSEMMQMDEEHGALWVGTEEEEYVLETDKSLRVFLVIQDRQFIHQAQNTEEVLSYYKLLLDEDFEQLTNVFNVRTK